MSLFVGLLSIATNVKTLGEEAGLEAQIFSLAQMPIGSTNVQFSTKPAFLPNVCYAFVFFHKSIINKQKIKLCSWSTIEITPTGIYYKPEHGIGKDVVLFNKFFKLSLE